MFKFNWTQASADIICLCIPRIVLNFTPFLVVCLIPLLKYNIFVLWQYKILFSLLLKLSSSESCNCRKKIIYHSNKTFTLLKIWESTESLAELSVLSRIEIILNFCGFLRYWWNYCWKIYPSNLNHSGQAGKSWFS